MIIVYILIGVIVTLLITYSIVLYGLYYKIFSCKNKKSVFTIDYTDRQLQRRTIVHEELVKHYETEAQEVTIKSFDNYNLSAKYFHNNDNGITIIHFHGFKSSNEKDCSGIKKIAFDMKYNLLIPNHRGHETSEGKCVTYGLKERKDVLLWAKYIAEKYPNNKIILSGASLGGTAVIMAADLDLPSNVIGILADAPFNGPYGIIHAILERRCYPKFITVSVNIASCLLAKIDLKEHDTIKSAINSKVPILVMHSQNDAIVPYSMSLELLEKAKDKIELHSFENIPHTASYFEEPERYTKIVLDFIERVQNENQ